MKSRELKVASREKKPLQPYQVELMDSLAYMLVKLERRIKELERHAANLIDAQR